jgi:hypothetical protein
LDVKRVNPFSAVVGLCLGLTAVANAGNPPLPELRELNLQNWGCLTNENGAAHSGVDAARNRMRNRRWVAAPKSAPRWTFEQFVSNVYQFDLEVGASSHKLLPPAQSDRLADIERQIVSVTGWLVAVSVDPPESANCGSAEFHDWRLELLASPQDHPPAPGDPTAIIGEITPRTETSIYRSGVRLQKLAAFIRTGESPNLGTISTGHLAHKVRMTGYLLWNDQRNQPQKDIGTTIASGGGNEEVRPSRVSAWEIHPVLKIEDLGFSH